MDVIIKYFSDVCIEKSEVLLEKLIGHIHGLHLRMPEDKTN